MNCENLLFYVQGELDESALRAFEAHLKTCARCQKDLLFVRRADQALAAPAAPGALVDKLFAKTTRKQSFWVRYKTVWLGFVAAAVVGVLFIPHPDKTPTLNAEVLAYLSENLDADYQTFASDLAEFENEF